MVYRRSGQARGNRLNKIEANLNNVYIEEDFTQRFSIPVRILGKFKHC
jgi:hypothetical protein